MEILEIVILVLLLCQVISTLILAFVLIRLASLSDLIAAVARNAGWIK